VNPPPPGIRVRRRVYNETEEKVLAIRRSQKFASSETLRPDYFLFADDPDTSSSRLETDAGALEATAARHSRRKEQYIAASSFVRLRPQ
jgi:hypothetical protein